MSTLPRACVIGAGSSGITAAKALHERGIPCEVIEMSDRVGGNWAINNPNGVSSAYRSLHINTSRERMEYSDFPMPKSYPDFPKHTHIARYFNDYVDHFGVRERIRFETQVEQAQRGADGVWELRLRGPGGAETRRYDALLVANGHHWDPRWPEPAFSGSFDGVEMHSHHYNDPDDWQGKRVVVLGMGNSAMDIAVESSYVAEEVFLAARRGAHVVPKYIFGRPIDQIGGSPLIPLAVRRRIIEAMLRVHQGRMENYGLPKPDHRFGEAHPTVSADLL
ncbi:MAG: NAD(P)-binding domain-containing protein, partial [Actinomycetota bacterium]|nr:NAD(P)-binding domain-containing protein [Actinomycetota bacterium]